MNEPTDAAESVPSCARTDAKTQNRDVQMKYDIAKNEDGPLQRTMKANAAQEDARTDSPATLQSGAKLTSTQDNISAARYPGLDERIQNIEKHFAIRYGT